MTRSRHISRRAAACGVVLMLLAASGCSKALDTFGMTGNVAAPAPQLIGPERLRVSLPSRDAQAVLGPVSRNGNITVWQTLDGISLSFRNGVLIETRGLGDDLMSSDAAGTLAMLRGAADGGYYPQMRSYLDGEQRTVFRSFQCRRTASGGGTPRAGTRIDETCVSTTETVTNSYWLDSTGRVIRSRQWVGPVVGYMETERVLQ